MPELKRLDIVVPGPTPVILIVAIISISDTCIEYYLFYPRPRDNIIPIIKRYI
jgi:hypothetical protein